MEYVYECRLPTMTGDFCKHLIKRFENDPNKYAGRLSGELVDTNQKKTTDLSINEKTWYKEHSQLNMVLRSGVDEYIEYIINDVGKGAEKSFRGAFNRCFAVTGYQIQKYGVGDHFNWHDDDKYKSKRLIAFIIYLNTLDTDSGGETQFWNGKSIRPIEGNILFFPATWSYIHRGAEVKKGFKYIITGFIEEV